MRRLVSGVLVLALLLLSAQPSVAHHRDTTTSARIAALEARVADLEARLAALEGPAPTPSPTAVPTPSPTATPTAAPTPTPTPTPTPASGWTEVFYDDFSTWDASRYSAYPSPWPDSSRNGRYQGFDNVSSDGSTLRIRLHTENGVREVTSFSPRVLVPGLPERYMESARIEFALRADLMRGYKMAPLLWPMSETWPRDGEIDFPEADFTGGTVSAFMHRQGATSGSDQDHYGTTAKHTDWHVYAIEWRDGVSAEFFVDGVSIGKSTSRVPNTPMRWQFQFETSLSGIVPDPATAGDIELDFLRISVP